MATEVIKIVDPDNGSGTNYTSLSAWEAGEQGDLTGARDEIAVAKCRCTGGTADSTNVTIDGWTTDADHYIKIWTDPSESYRHDGKWTTGNKYRLTSSAAWGIGTISIAEAYVRIIGLQIDNTAANQAVGISLNSLTSTTSSRIEIVNNIVRMTGGGGSGVHYGIVGLEKANCYVVNNIVYDYEYGIFINWDTTAVVNCIYSNTVIDCSLSGIANYASVSVTKRAYNNIVQGTSSEGNYVDTGWSASGNNISEDATSPNSAYRTKTVTFVSEAGDDFHLSSSDTEARGNGANLYNDSYYAFQNDIDGQDRGGSGATWDIGADEYLNSSLPPQLLTPQRSIQHLLVR